MTVVVESREDFTLDNYRRVALEGESVELGSHAVETMERAREGFLRLLNGDRTAFIYGTTTGGGALANRLIPPDRQGQRAAEAGRRRRPGNGFGGALPERVVRGIIFARLANFVEGHAKCRPAVAQRIASMLDRPLPKVPLDGQVGAGEILPLAHVMSALPDGDWEEGEPGAPMNGSPCSAALVADVALQAASRLELAVSVFALSVEAFNAPLEAYDEALERLWGDRFEAKAIRGLNVRLEGVPTTGRRPYQAPVSYRVLPRIIGQAYRAVEAVERAAAISLRSITANPVYIPPTGPHPDGRVFSTGGYHNGVAYPALDGLSAAWADLCTIADRHTMKLHNGAVSLLPNMLVRDTAFEGPTEELAFTQVGYGEEARRAAQRTFLPPSEGGGYGGQDDVASPTFLAYAKERRAGWCLDASMAILAVVASQALWVTERPAPASLAGLVDTVRDAFPPDEGASGVELERLAQGFATAALDARVPGLDHVGSTP